MVDGGIYLGLDLSTQSLKGIVLSGYGVERTIIVRFDEDLPSYGTVGGVYSCSGEVTSSPLMWVEALDLLLTKLKETGIDMSSIEGVCGAAQQHGSVWCKWGTSGRLSNLDGSRTLVEQLAASFSLEKSPVWMDSSTSVECALLEESLGGSEEVARLTGSRAFERFTGCQIMKIMRKNREAFDQTEHICLVSSFLASLWIGRRAPMDWSDASGTNMFDIGEKLWSSVALSACSWGNTAALSEKIGHVVSPMAVLGPVHKYFQTRYGFSPSCQVIAHTGDNPSSLVALGIDLQSALISLGTSDTILAETKSPSPSGKEGHVLISPFDPDEFSVMIVRKNGSLARERIRNECAFSSWDTFNELLASTPPGNGGNVGFYFFEPEIAPPVRRPMICRFCPSDEEVSSFTCEMEVRACVESFCLSLRVHAERVGIAVSSLTRLFVTGGGSANIGICQVISDVFNSPVDVIRSTSNSAALGAAMRARRALVSKELWMEEFGRGGVERLACPCASAVAVYDSLVPRFARLEDVVVRRGMQ